jgi:hypothetical protein
MGRTAKVTAVAFAVFVFLGVSILLARALVGPGNERSEVLELLHAEARGDSDAVLARLAPCRAEPACVTVVRERAPKLRRPGKVLILQYEPSVQVALTRQQGTARVAWRTDADPDPVVQCVKVVREGPLTGGHAELVAISGPLPGTASCP